MMFKQIITALTVICVSILMLTLVIVPHHHHNGLPCFTVESTHDYNPICNNHHSHCDDNHACCEHHQDESNSENEDTCVLDQLEFIAIDKKTTPVCSVCLHLHNHHLLQAVLLTFNYNFSLPDKPDISPQIPYLINYHSFFASRSIGLRAPPLA